MHTAIRLCGALIFGLMQSLGPNGATQAVAAPASNTVLTIALNP